MDEGSRKIIHIDMDCFFAAIEMHDNPQYKGKPLAVGGQAQSRSVLCTANYEARKFGVHSALSSAIAVKRCPELIIVKPRGARYREVSLQVQSIFHQYTDKVEMLSLDEGFLDVTEYCRQHKTFATKVAKEIREKIQEKTGITASAGIAPNKFLAKVSSDWNKPNGQWVVTPEMAADFAYHLELKKVPGIGAKTLERCHHLGLYKLGDIREKGILWAKDHFGKSGHSFYLKSQGLHFSPVGSHGQRKSISCEHTFAKDLLSLQEINDQYPLLIADLDERIERYYNKDGAASHLLPPVKKLFIKMKTKDFKNHTHEFIKSDEAKWDLEIFKRLGQTLYNNIGAPPIRLLGIGVKLHYTHKDELEELGQLRLF